MTDHTLFSRKAPGIMRQLMADFDLTVDQAAAILGNIGHECAGFAILQEIKPLVPGSRGGWGWCQWTGPRRRQFEAYVARNSLDPSGDKANYGFLWNELKGLIGTEGGAIGKLKKAGPTLRDKVVAFELAFLRAGIKHYESRLTWAERALEAYGQAPAGEPPIPSPEPPEGFLGAILAFLRRLFTRT